MSDTPITFAMPEAVRQLWIAQQALAAHYRRKGLRFTLDGRLVGDIAEALALDHFALTLPTRRTKGVDALTAAGQTVQVKATGKAGTGPAFTPGTGRAEFLLFFVLDFERNTATVAYNGPEAPVRTAMLSREWTGTKVLSLVKMRELAAKVPAAQRIAPGGLALAAAPFPREADIDINLMR
ncbi:DUF6998 domain-containing protein [Burkholderia plantarii]|uniref:DUF6998 domain-containing protein n=1 Tax=Burkholderia plantarii TaxID=41899 RepID=A0A0B6RW72_BURPL|nr:hypothetical protein [Burkholderia plantarii]AJK49617.1 hypothetical protein BGL_2c15500 [Burkholderia plantarii]